MTKLEAHELQLRLTVSALVRWYETHESYGNIWSMKFGSQGGYATLKSSNESKTRVWWSTICIYKSYRNESEVKQLEQGIAIRKRSEKVIS